MTDVQKSVEMFTVAGVSKHTNGTYKVRFALDLVRHNKRLTKNGNDDVYLVQLPSRMSKSDAVAYLKTTPLYGRPEFAEAINTAEQRYASQSTVRIKLNRRGRPSKADVEAFRQQQMAAMLQSEAA